MGAIYSGAPKFGLWRGTSVAEEEEPHSPPIASGSRALFDFQCGKPEGRRNANQRNYSTHHAV
jgi:uncharacterized Zn-finger protein